ncbi:uncharacterized protein MKK02DRAFT_39460 [Dioszegia hungarica]|uniref:Uncharacterized protein n=1 Tax=Dioszegia hungarica TaxID=4972 RepID=A0AA38HDK8_9TREE|nr:uncharacterized protein MKK02DRAFT_39460 [Dioszegia hungarica]KAI9639167.1 hypothetical protein MKK02DRAFT_39460 [Dioszegia hungarica]
MRTNVLFFAAVLASTAQAAVIAPEARDHTLVARDACSNGVKIRGSGSISCSGRQCRACSGGKCCNVTAPNSSSCNSATPYLNIDTCTFEGSSGGGGGSPTTTFKTTAPATTSKAGATAQPQPTRAPSKTFGDFLRSYFGGRY